jgi:tetratricopeptide (TPR) repeat protein
MTRIAPAVIAVVTTFALVTLHSGRGQASPRTAPESSPQTSAAASQQAAPQTQPSPTDSKLREAFATFRNGDYARALALLREVIAGDPNNIYAHNLAGNCSLKLKDYRSGIDSFKRALQIQPDEWHNLAGLSEAYTLAGLTKERDELREHVHQLSRTGGLPPDFHYVFDAFDVNGRKVEVVEFPRLFGQYEHRYDFNVFNREGKLEYRVALGSPDFDQAGFRKEHPELAAAGGRRFSLDGYSAGRQVLYRFYDGEPPYEQVRDEVKQILARQK